MRTGNGFDVHAFGPGDAVDALRRPRSPTTAASSATPTPTSASTP